MWLPRWSGAAPFPYPHPGRGSTRLPRGRRYAAKAHRCATGDCEFRADSSTEELLLARIHSGAVVVSEQVQQPVHERPAPLVADDLGTQDDVTELARHAVRQRIAAVDRERQDVG